MFLILKTELKSVSILEMESKSVSILETEFIPFLFLHITNQYLYFIRKYSNNFNFLISKKY